MVIFVGRRLVPRMSDINLRERCHCEASQELMTVLVQIALGIKLHDGMSRSLNKARGQDRSDLMAAPKVTSLGRACSFCIVLKILSATGHCHALATVLTEEESEATFGSCAEHCDSYKICRQFAQEWELGLGPGPKAVEREHMFHQRVACDTACRHPRHTTISVGAEIPEKRQSIGAFVHFLGLVCQALSHCTPATPPRRLVHGSWTICYEDSLKERAESAKPRQAQLPVLSRPRRSK